MRDFYRPRGLPVTQQTVSKYWRKNVWEVLNVQKIYTTRTLLKDIAYRQALQGRVELLQPMPSRTDYDQSTAGGSSAILLHCTRCRRQSHVWRKMRPRCTIPNRFSWDQYVSWKTVVRVTSAYHKHQQVIKNSLKHDQLFLLCWCFGRDRKSTM